jgi:putative glycosyltransferase
MMNPVKREQNQFIEISIVTTMYHSPAFVAEFHKRSSEAAVGLALSYEIIFVNDGSPDDSISKAKLLVEADPRVRVIDLSRNFGHHRALMVGIEHAQGRKIFLIDCDLEEDPHSLSAFFAEMIRTNADVVYGVQNTRKGGIVKSIGGRLFWNFFNFISELNVNPKVITSRLMTRRYVDALLGFRERELFLAGIFALAGFEQVPLIVNKEARIGTTYTLRKRFALLVNAVTSFSSRPLIFVFYIGLIISLISSAAAAVLLVRRLLVSDYQLGWPSIMVSIWLIGGITIFCIGLIGIYLAKVFQEVKDRPLSIVRAVHERSENPPSSG